MRRTHGDAPAVITTVPMNKDDEFDKRKKRYAIMMATRALFVLLAACLYRVSVPLAVGFGIAGLVLPWCAVILANDRPPKRKQAKLGTITHTPERGLPSGSHPTVDG